MPKASLHKFATSTVTANPKATVNPCVEKRERSTCPKAAGWLEGGFARIGQGDGGLTLGQQLWRGFQGWQVSGNIRTGACTSRVRKPEKSTAIWEIVAGMSDGCPI